jgi:hypothetical protein
MLSTNCYVCARIPFCAVIAHPGRPGVESGNGTRTPDRWFMPACVNFKFGVRCPCNTLEENRLKRCGLVVRPTGRLGPHAATVTMLQQILLAGNEFSDYNPEGFGWAT